MSAGTTATAEHLPAATAEPSRPGPGAPGRYTELAARMLAEHPGRREVSRQTARAFGRALAATEPKSPHGRLLVAALQPRPAAERGQAEQLIHWLASRGETPTAGAVASHLADTQRRIRSRGVAARCRARADQLAGRDAMRAAVHVAVVVASTGTGPTWAELCRAMEWPRECANVVVARLVRGGWLEASEEPRSMRPGRTFQQRTEQRPGQARRR